MVDDQQDRPAERGPPDAPRAQQAGGHGEWATDGPRAEDHPRTTIAFVLSLVALVFVVLLFWLIIPPLLAIPMAIVGIVFAGQARRDMKAQPGRYRNEGLATAALVLGWITLGLIVLGIVLVVLVVAIFSDSQFQEQILEEMQRQSLRRLPR